MSEIARAEAILRAACDDRLRTAFPMAPLTTFRIGGPAALYLEPDSDADLEAASQALAVSGLPHVVIGKGSNVLVSDRGFEGLVIRLGRGYRWAAREGDRLAAGGSMPLPALAGVALRHGLTGLEFGVAIPASLGGSVKMNAGAHGGEMADVIVEIETFRLDEGRAERVAAADAGFSYRRTDLAAGAVVTAATAALRPGPPDRIRAAMDEARSWRRRTQPLAEPNCGSVFKNPPNGHAAALIEESGLKGTRVGDAQVSTKHANFIVAGEAARAEDVRTLIDLIRRAVETRTGVTLEPEVQMIGGFDRVTR
ncbi:MAG TPA: UDP-N-acetylmuramate dehydrogenase [Actinomycetota bacterium]|jgi:UDP-N-acetylmuramate dehydrogenase|nr:UDP-N-acetylmuramate dehydrogenase [Actinomycetota bacterium]